MNTFFNDLSRKSLHNKKDSIVRWVKRIHPNVRSVQTRVAILTGIGLSARERLLDLAGVPGDKRKYFDRDGSLRSGQFDVVVFCGCTIKGGQFPVGVAVMHKVSSYQSPWNGYYPIYPIYTAFTNRRYEAKWVAQNFTDWFYTEMCVPLNPTESGVHYILKHPPVHCMESFNLRGVKAGMRPENVDMDRIRYALFTEAPGAVRRIRDLIEHTDPFDPTAKDLLFGFLAKTPLWTMFYRSIGWTHLPANSDGYKHPSGPWAGYGDPLCEKGSGFCTKVLPAMWVNREVERDSGFFGSSLPASYMSALKDLSVERVAPYRENPTVVAVPILGASNVLEVSPDYTFTVPSLYVNLSHGFTRTTERTPEAKTLPQVVFPADRGFVLSRDALK